MRCCFCKRYRISQDFTYLLIAVLLLFIVFASLSSCEFAYLLIGSLSPSEEDERETVLSANVIRRFKLSDDRKH